MNRFDLRHVIRRLLRTPGFSATSVLLLGLAFGALACMFSVVYGLLYKPLPYPDDDRLVSVETHMLGFPFNAGLSVPLLEDMAKNTRTLDGIAGYRKDRLALRDEVGRSGTTFDVARVEPVLFGLLGVQPALGRLFADEDAAQGAAKNVLISWDEWQQRFAGSADAVGKRIRLGNDEWLIAGVLPRGFAFPSRDTQAWLPLGFTAQDRDPKQIGEFDGLYGIARMRTDTGIATASSDLNSRIAASPQLREAFGRDSKFHAEAKPLRDLWVGERREALLLMLAAVAMVWIVTAANVVNLFLARALARRHEAALTAALGATPSRRAVATAIEASILCMAGVLLGFVLLPAGLALLRSFDLLPSGTPQTIGIDGATTLLLAMLAAVLCAMLVAAGLSVQRGNLGDMIRHGGSRQTSGGAAQVARKTLVIAQIALTVALLFGIGVLLRSSQHLLAEDVGFARDHLVYADLDDLVPAGAKSELHKTRMEQLVARARMLQGVTSAGLGNMVPFSGSTNVSTFSPPGRNDIEPQPPTYKEEVDEGYFAALGVPLRRGRAFDADEVRSRAPLAIVDELFVQRYLGDADPIGRHFKMGVDDNTSGRDLTIVGVVPTVKQNALGETPDRVAIYQPDPAPNHAALILRTSVEPATIIASLKTLFKEVAPDGNVGSIVSMNERIADTLRDRDRLNTLLGLLGATALLLATVGLYAVLAYAVRQRVPEFGVRMALGARASNVLREVLAQGMRLIVVGVVLGMPLAWAFARLLSSRLYRTSTFDLPTLIAVATTLAAVGVVACWLPARRAAATDPIEALRHE